MLIFTKVFLINIISVITIFVTIIIGIENIINIKLTCKIFVLIIIIKFATINNIIGIKLILVIAITIKLILIIIIKLIILIIGVIIIDIII